MSNIFSEFEYNVVINPLWFNYICPLKNPDILKGGNSMCNCRNKNECKCNCEAIELICKAIRCLEAGCNDLRRNNNCRAKEHICAAIRKAQEASCII